MSYINKLPSINIMDAIISSNYSPEYKDYITSILYDLFVNERSHIFLLIDEHILVVRHIIIGIKLGQKTYPVNLLIYFTKEFPSLPPEIYIEKTGNISVQPQASYFVDSSDLRVKNKFLTEWNPMSSSISKVLEQIHADCSMRFPVYSLAQHEPVRFYPGRCNLKNFLPVSLDSQILKSPDVITGTGTKTRESVKEKFDDEAIRKVYLKNLISVLVPKIKIERDRLEEHKQKLLITKSSFVTEMKKIETLSEKRDAIINTINQISTEVSDKIALLKEYISLNSQNEFHVDRIDNLIKVSDPITIKLICMEHTIEDFIFHVKKAFVVKLFTFEEAIKLIRRYSRELFLIRHLRLNKS